MKPAYIFSLALAFMTLSARAQEPPALNTQKAKISYMIGVQIAGTFRSQGLDVDADLVAAGLKDVLSGAMVRMSEEEMKATMAALQQEMTEKQAQAKSVAAENNRKAGEAFLAENAKKEGVVTQTSGLQYKILKPADGKKPTASDTILCNYRGTLTDGTEFDSSYSSGRPASFRVGELIPGVSEALQLMTVGSTWQFFIPSNLAYGDRGVGEAIGPNATLVFEIELISIQ